MPTVMPDWPAGGFRVDVFALVDATARNLEADDRIACLDRDQIGDLSIGEFRNDDLWAVGFEVGGVQQIAGSSRFIHVGFAHRRGLSQPSQQFNVVHEIPQTQ